jgi:hypothetical protein
VGAKRDKSCRQEESTERGMTIMCGPQIENRSQREQKKAITCRVLPRMRIGAEISDQI